MELTPELQDHFLPLSIWKAWSPQVRDRAIREFLLGRPPFFTRFDISSDGSTVSLKKFSKLASKPGTVLKHRKQGNSYIILRDLALIKNQYA